MRGGFVCRIGWSRADQPRVHRAADWLRWHVGHREEHALGPAFAVLLVDDHHGPFLVASPGETILVHGSGGSSFADLQESGDRFAALEAKAERVRLTRDRMGEVPLFYRQVSDAVWISTEIRPLLSLGTPRANLRALTAYVAGVQYPAETGWDGIRRLLPGATIEIDHDLKLSCSRYWKPTLGDPDLDYGTAVETFRELFDSAVRKQTSARTGILIGGLDSSAVAVTAARFHSPQLLAFSYDGLPMDETEYVRAVAQAANLPLEIVPGATDRWDPLDDLRTFSVPCIKLPTGVYDNGIRRLAELGCDTVLDGHDADGVVGALHAEVANTLLDGRIREVARSFAEFGVRTMMRAMVAEFAGPGIRHLLRRPYNPPAAASRVPYFRGHVRELLQHEFRWQPPREGWNAIQLRPFLPPATQAFEELEMLAARYDVDIRHPFAERRLIEFVISLPHRTKSSPLRTKQILRDALGEYLPELVTARPGKAEFTPAADARVDFESCYRLIRDAGVRLPELDYGKLFRDAPRPVNDRSLWTRLALAHVFLAHGADT